VFPIANCIRDGLNGGSGVSTSSKSLHDPLSFGDADTVLIRCFHLGSGLNRPPHRCRKPSSPNSEHFCRIDAVCSKNCRGSGVVLCRFGPINSASASARSTFKFVYTSRHSGSDNNLLTSCKGIQRHSKTQKSKESSKNAWTSINREIFQGLSGNLSQIIHLDTQLPRVNNL
jgi:hypothetical protein